MGVWGERVPGWWTGSKSLDFTYRWFDRTIILFITLNSIAMACYDYSDRDEKTFRNQIINKISTFFSVVFTIEFMIKVVAKGFYLGWPTTYMKDGWNIIDFIVVVFSWIVYVPGLPNFESLGALRTVRVIRPLRSIQAVPAMRKIVGALLASLSSLSNVFVFLLFVFVLFGILGV